MSSSWWACVCSLVCEYNRRWDEFIVVLFPHSTRHAYAAQIHSSFLWWTAVWIVSFPFSHHHHHHHHLHFLRFSWIVCPTNHNGANVTAPRTAYKYHLRKQNKTNKKYENCLGNRHRSIRRSICDSNSIFLNLEIPFRAHVSPLWWRNCVCIRLLGVGADDERFRFSFLLFRSINVGILHLLTRHHSQQNVAHFYPSNKWEPFWPASISIYSSSDIIAIA